MGFGREQFQEGVGDESPGDAVGDAEGELHDDDGEEGRDSFGEVVPFDVADDGEHVAADDNEDGGDDGEALDGHIGGGGAELFRRNGNFGAKHLDKGIGKDGNQHQKPGNDGGQAGAGPDGDAGGGLDVTGDGAGAHDGAGEGAEGVSHEGLFGAGELAVFHQAGALAQTDQGADGIEDIQKQKGENHQDYRLKPVRKKRTQTRGSKDFTGGFGDLRKFSSGSTRDQDILPG